MRVSVSSDEEFNMEIISEPVIRKRADVESDHDDKHHRKKRHKTHHEDRSNSHSHKKAKRHYHHHHSKHNGQHSHKISDIKRSDDGNSCPVDVPAIKISSDNDSDYKCGRISSIRRSRELDNMGCQPFTRRQKDSLCKLIGAETEIEKKKVKLELDPNVFDAEIDSDEDSRPVLKVNAKEKESILGQYLIPVEKCISAVDEIVFSDDNEGDAEELPDLDVQIIGVTYNYSKSVKNLLSLEDIRTKFPRLKFDKAIEIEMCNSKVLQPTVKLERLQQEDCIDLTKSPTPHISTKFVSRVPRLRLRQRVFPALEDGFIKQETVDTYEEQCSTVLSLGEDVNQMYHNFPVKQEPVSSEEEEERVDNQYEYDNFNFRYTGKKFQWRKVNVASKHNANVIDNVYSGTGRIRDQYGQKYRVIMRKCADYRLLCSEPFQENIIDCQQKCKVHPFRPNMINTVESCFEEGDEFLEKVITMTQHFVSKTQEPPTYMLKAILFDILLKCGNPRIVRKAFNLLTAITGTHPPRDELPFQWDDIDHVISSICFPLGIDSCSKNDVHKNILALKYMVHNIEMELFNRTVSQQRQIFLSVAYKWLSSDSSFSTIRAILRWIFQSISFGEYSELQRAFTNLSLSSDSKEDQGEEKEDLYIPKVFPILDKLLDISLAVSPHPVACAGRIATDISYEYNQMTDLIHKTFIIEHISNPLLRFKLVNIILSNCSSIDDTWPVTDIQSLENIIEGPFRALPPRNALTPPPSPNDEEEEINRGEVIVSSEAVEELVMLIWHCVNSYIATSKKRLVHQLSRRTLEVDSKEEKLNTTDIQALKQLPIHVEHLERRLSTMAEFTSRTVMYLICLKSASVA